MPVLSVQPVRVQGPRSIETCYDVCMDGKPIQGMRYERRGHAMRDMAALERSETYRRYQSMVAA